MFCLPCRVAFQMNQSGVWICDVPYLGKRLVQPLSTLTPNRSDRLPGSCRALPAVHCGAVLKRDGAVLGRGQGPEKSRTLAQFFGSKHKVGVRHSQAFWNFGKMQSTDSCRNWHAAIHSAQESDPLATSATRGEGLGEQCQAQRRWSFAGKD